MRKDRQKRPIDMGRRRFFRKAGHLIAAAGLAALTVGMGGSDRGETDSRTSRKRARYYRKLAG